MGESEGGTDSEGVEKAHIPESSGMPGWLWVLYKRERGQWSAWWKKKRKKKNIYSIYIKNMELSSILMQGILNSLAYLFD